MKKIISLCLVLAMAISCFGVTALAETSMPDCKMTILKGEDLVLTGKLKSECAGELTLDFGMNFKALQTAEEVDASPYKDYLCDFEITFSEDVNAILAGQYDKYDPNWVALWVADGGTYGDLTDKGYQFKKGEKVKVMGVCTDILKNNGYITNAAKPSDYTYEFVAKTVNDFDCGVKVTDNKDVDITLQLCLYDPENPEVSIPCGDPLVFNYKADKLPEALNTKLTKDELNVVFRPVVGDTYNEKLDFGMNFKALDTVEDLVNNPFADYVVDFEVKFTDDTTAILAGQYNGWSEEWDKDWIALKGNNADLGLTDAGYSFQANEPVRVMQTAMKAVNVVTPVDYATVVEAIKEFNCGLKVTSNNDTTVTLALCIYERDANGNETGKRYEIGDVLTFDYKGVTIPEEAEDADEIVEIINNATSINEAAKDDVVEAIKNLDEEKQAEIKPEVIEAVAKEEVTVKEVVEEDVVNVPAEVATIPGTNAGLEVTVTAEPEQNGMAAFDVDAFVDGEEIKDDYIEAPVLVKIPLSELGADVTGVAAVYHEHNGVVEKIDFVIVDRYVCFTMNKFSGIYIQPLVLTAGEATLELVQITNGVEEGTAKYNLVLHGDTFRTIQNFGGGQFNVAIQNGGFEFEVAPNTTLYKISDEVYQLTVDGEVEDIWTKDETYSENNSFVLGTFTITSRTQGTLTISDITMNKHTDSVINGGTDTTVITVTNATAVANFDVKPPVRKLDVEVYLAHNVANKNALYQAMKVTIKNGNTVVKEFNLGNDKDDVTFENNTYKVSAMLEKDARYSVEVTGLGYRKGTYSVSMTTDKTLKFWNNIVANGQAMEIYSDADSNPVKNGTAVTNFLAGDIVADDEINIYDLSAVVSYFGQLINNTIEESPYATYDLNRDGYINSKDVIIVTNGWKK